jgi:hypothetical protein
MKPFARGILTQIGPGARILTIFYEIKKGFVNAL